MNYLGTVSENDLVDYEYNNRKNKIRRTCPMRHENGNCLAAGGFCTAVNDEICQALHNAYEAGRDSLGVILCKNCKYCYEEEGINFNRVYHCRKTGYLLSAEFDYSCPDAKKREEE